MSIGVKSKELWGKFKGGFQDFGKYWHHPKDGEYVSYKEFFSFVIGAGSSNTAASAGYNLAFVASCLFVGAIYKIRMMDLAMFSLVGVLLSYLFSPIGMVITDNLGRPPKKTMRIINWVNLAFTVVGVACFFVPQTYFESFMPALPQIVGTKFLIQVFSTYWNIMVYRLLSPKFGKYRCWIVANTVPYVLSLFLVAWFPYNTFAYHTKFWVMNLFFAFNGTFSSCFGQTFNVQNVISPNTNERTRIMSIGSFIYSLIPSIYNVVFPFLATLAGGMTDIWTYKLVVPCTAAVLSPFVFFLAFGCKDRVVQEEEHKPQVDMLKGFKEVLKNKYLWIMNISTWITTFTTGQVNIINMLIIYSMRKDWVLGIMSTILGTAWTPGMLLAPWLIRKFGKKKITLLGKYTQFFCGFISIAGVYMDSFLLIVLSSYISTVMASLLDIAQRSMTADLWDYQQYMSGERLDGCMGIFGYISSPFVTLAGMLIPYLYGRIGFTSDWNILYNPDIRSKIFMVTIIVSTIVGLLAIIPFHFYDFTEQRHEEIMEELRQRVAVNQTEEDAAAPMPSAEQPEEQPAAVQPAE